MIPMGTCVSSWKSCRRACLSVSPIEFQCDIEVVRPWFVLNVNIMFLWLLNFETHNSVSCAFQFSFTNRVLRSEGVSCQKWSVLGLRLTTEGGTEEINSCIVNTHTHTHTVPFNKNLFATFNFCDLLLYRSTNLRCWSATPFYFSILPFSANIFRLFVGCWSATIAGHKLSFDVEW